jgi:hypothetical protein
MIFSQATPPSSEPALAPGAFTWTPDKSTNGPLTLLVSEPDKQVYVYRNGMEIGRAALLRVAIDGQHVFSALDDTDEQGRRKWIRVDGQPAAQDPNIAELAQQAGVAEAFLAGVRSVLVPGTTLVFTDQPVNRQTQSAPDFKILTPGDMASR